MSDPGAAPSPPVAPSAEARARGGSRLANWLLVGALVVAALTQLSLYDRVLQDDAYISFVYARNLVRGEGLVYNAGEPAVEGYSNFLWTVIVAGGMGLGLDPKHVSQVLGIIAALGIVLATARLARRLGSPPAFAAGAALLLAANLAFHMEAVGGLETPLFGMLVLAGLSLRLGEASRARDVGAALCLALAALTRPEGSGVFAILEGCTLARTLGAAPAERRSALRGTALRVILFAGIVGAHLLWRWSTYGDLVPNTFHAKVSGGAGQARLGLQYVSSGVLRFGPVLFLMPFVLLPWRWRHAPVGTCLALSAGYAAYVVWIGGDFKPTFRYLMPILPVWCALGVDAFRFVGDRLRSRLAGAAPVVAAAVLTALGAWGAARVYELSVRWIGREERYRELVAVGELLHEILPREARIAVSNAGIIPYFADCHVIDMLGLNDRHIARQPVQPVAPTATLTGHEKGDGAYVLAQEPDAILFIRLTTTREGSVSGIRGPLASMPTWEQAVRTWAFGTSEIQIAGSPDFYRHYEPRSARLPGGNVHANYFLRRGPD